MENVYSRWPGRPAGPRRRLPLCVSLLTGLSRSKYSAIAFLCPTRNGYRDLLRDTGCCDIFGWLMVSVVRSQRRSWRLRRLRERRVRLFGSNRFQISSSAFQPRSLPKECPACEIPEQWEVDYLIDLPASYCVDNKAHDLIVLFAPSYVVSD